MRVELASDEALHREDGVLGVGEGLALGDLADEALALGGEADDRRRRARPFLVGDDLGRAPLHDRHAGVRGAEVDSDHLAQAANLRSSGRPNPAPSVPVFGPPLVLLFGLATFTRAGRSKPVLEGIALAEDLHHGAVLETRHGFVGERLVALRVEGMARGDRRSRRPGPRGRDRSSRWMSSTPCRRGPVVAVRLEGALEVVEARDELAGGRAAAASRPACCAVALDALPEVLEVGAAAQELVLEVVPLAAERLEGLRRRRRRRARARPRPGPWPRSRTRPRLRPSRRRFPCRRSCAQLRESAGDLAGDVVHEGHHAHVLHARRAHDAQGPAAPRPRPGSAAVTRERSRRSGSGFSWPMTIRSPCPGDARVQDLDEAALLLEGLEEGPHPLDVVELGLVEDVRGAVEVDARRRPRRRRRRALPPRRRSSGASRRGPSPRASARAGGSGSPTARRPRNAAFR